MGVGGQVEYGFRSRQKQDREKLWNRIMVYKDYKLDYGAWYTMFTISSVLRRRIYTCEAFKLKKRVWKHYARLTLLCLDYTSGMFFVLTPSGIRGRENRPCRESPSVPPATWRWTHGRGLRPAPAAASSGKLLARPSARLPACCQP